MKAKTICPKCAQQEGLSAVLENTEFQLESIIDEMQKDEVKRLQRQIATAGELLKSLQSRYRELVGQDYKYINL